MRSLLFSLTLLLPAAPTFAQVRLPAIFGDGMVLQRDAAIRVWGWAAPGERVTVSLGEENVGAQADGQGHFSVRMAKRRAGGPLRLEVRGASTKVACKDVLIGDVWVCSGQSNMEFALKRAKNAEKEIEQASFARIRLFTVKRKVSGEPLADVQGSWSICAPKTAAPFSAVGYFFGRRLHVLLGVPIGLVQSAWGGTPSEAWTSEQTTHSVAAFQPIIARWDKVLAGAEQAAKGFQERLARWREASAEARSQGKRPRRRPRPPRGPNHPHRISGLYNGMIAPISRFSIRGAIWYQGESNAGRAYQYSKIFPAMIQDWRARWDQGDFPFLFVQLANFTVRNHVTWAELREAQRMALSLPHTGMAVAIDIGNPHNIHPTNKQEVGRRLAQLALARVYGKDVEDSGPVYTGMEVKGRAVVLSFSHLGGGLAARDGGALKGFTIAGSDGVFVPASAEIDGDRILVTGAVTQPTMVRYAWTDNPDCNLVNAAGLPASPFRTDQLAWTTRAAK